MDLLSFEVDRYPYALAVADVQEVLRAVAIVPLPNAPLVVSGIINLRGRVIPVFDLRIRFGAPHRPVHVDEHFIVLSAGERTVALRTDRAVGLIKVEEAHVALPGSVVRTSAFVAGLASLPDGVVLISDALSFLTEAESAELDEALGAQVDVAPSERG